MHDAIHAASIDFITRPPRDVQGWAACFDPVTLPVLSATAIALEDMRANEEAVDAHMMAEVIELDPLMTLKLFAHVARMRRGREGSDPETVTGALVMLGITPFFRAFGPQPTVEDCLAGQDEALEGFRAVLVRSRRAARFALAFAVQRVDYDTAAIHGAALLHGFAELLLWLRAPALALEIAQRQRADPGLRSCAVQRERLNIELADLQHLLMTLWRLPRLLIDITDHRKEADSTQARNVLLAIRLARHTTEGWNNAALPDDLRDVAELLHMAIEPTLALLQDVDAA